MVTLEFDDTPDETGKGRVVVDGRYFGLPVDAVRLFEKLYTQDQEKQDETIT